MLFKQFLGLWMTNAILKQNRSKQCLIFHNCVLCGCMSPHTGQQRPCNKLFVIYEGCPSKSCTFFITQDCAIGIIWNLYDLYICISQISCHNLNELAFIIWAASSEFGTYRLCEQRRFRRACASAQSRQNLRCSLIQAVSQEEPSDKKPDPWPLWMAGHAQLNLSWRNARRHKFAWRGLLLTSNFRYLSVYGVGIKVILFVLTLFLFKCE